MSIKIGETIEWILGFAHAYGITRVVWIICACVLIAIGIIGWFLPFMPGWPFALWGFSILMKNVPFVAWLHAWCSRAIERRWPRVYVRLVAADATYHRVLSMLGAWLLSQFRRIIRFLKIH